MIRLVNEKVGQLALSVVGAVDQLALSVVGAVAQLEAGLGGLRG